MKVKPKKIKRKDSWMRARESWITELVLRALPLVLLIIWLSR